MNVTKGISKPGTRSRHGVFLGSGDCLGAPSHMQYVFIDSERRACLDPLLGYVIIYKLCFHVFE